MAIKKMAQESISTTTKESSKLHLIGCGGAGINITAGITHTLQTLGDKFCKVDARFIDTTDKTIQAHPAYKDMFKQVTSKRVSVDTIDGMAGERVNKELAMDIDIHVKEYTDILSNNKDDYYVIIASASGGSGSIISPLLMQAMLKRDFNVIVVLVGDSSNLLNLNNTINTITTFQSIAKRTSSAISVIYYNNTMNGVTTPSTEKGVNNKICSMLSIISMFCSGNVQNIDNQDMANFIIPSRYKTFNIQSGIYSLGVAKDVLEDTNTLLARTIIGHEDSDVKVRVPLLHNKVGIVSGELLNKFNELPLYLLFRKNVLQSEIATLKDELEAIEKLRNINYDEFDNIDTATDEDDLGLVL